MSGPAYEPVQWSSDHHDDERYNNVPPSPDARTTLFHPSESMPLGGHDDLPPGAAPPPRFLGSTLASEGMNPRESYASSNSFPIQDDYNSSVYALNEQKQGGSRDPSFYYHDDPSEPGYGSQVNFGKSSESPYLAEKRNAYSGTRKRGRRVMIWGAVVVGILLLAGIALAVYFGVIKPKNDDKDVSGGVSDNGKGGSSSARPSASGTPSSLAVVTGGDGSKVTTDDGSTFTYSNKFGGYWYWDPSDPFNNGAKAQSWTPALNETFNYGVDIVRGVNIGGWLNTEPFM
ncbi:hypothetical protein EIP91_005700 [Steccherinum ochraceum]|uniref:Uncharacterized protein n=1 Tax=Steccherinum ochraceum TaxID=92696 RepID=A0A4R0RHR4_9APHY|nr:hypothetical protein EIP91_005700 [Steccherinum ochraceum]